MLVLSRKTHEQIQIGDNITITVVRVEGKRVRIGIDAPSGVRIMRTEIADQKPRRPVDHELSASTQSSPTGAGGLSLVESGGDCPTVPSDKDQDVDCDTFSRPAPDARPTSRIRPQERLGPAMLRSLMALR